MRKFYNYVSFATMITLMIAFAMQAIALRNNNINATQQYASSKLITTKVKSALLTKKDIDSTNIKVHSKAVEKDKTIVILSGTQKSQELIDLAVETARNVNGVTAVINSLRVAG